MFDISMLVPGLPIRPDSLETGSLGGSETAGIQMARALVARGHSVKLFCNTESRGKGKDGVTYIGQELWQAYQRTTVHDVAIAQRTPQAFALPTTAELNLLWCHDMALGRMRDQFISHMWNIDQVMILSKYMQQNYKDVYNFPERFCHVTRNGLDLSIPRNPLPLEERDRKLIVYAARPERGLDFLLSHVMPRVLAAEPEARLLIVGYDNPVDTHNELYARCTAMAQHLKGAVKHGGYLRKEELYALYSRAAVYAYPTPSPAVPEFREVSCISVMEAQLCGLPIVSTWCGALPESVSALAGILVRTAPSTDQNVSAEEHASAIIRLLREDSRWRTASAAGLERAKTLSWDSVAGDWEVLIDKLYTERNDCPVRLARHMLRRSDVFAAKRALETCLGNDAVSLEKQDEARSLRKGIEADYGFTNSREEFFAHYSKAGTETLFNLRSRPISDYRPCESDEPRFHDIERRLRALKPATVLDFGCGHGWMVAYLAPRFPDTRFVCADIDPGAIEWSLELLTAHCPEVLDRVQFVTGDILARDFDVAIVSEVLEHCIDPWETLASVEAMVRPGGALLITTPYGPSEYGTPNWDRFRGHLWEFNLHDIREVLGDKPEIVASATRIFDNEVTGEPIGYLFIEYQADHAPAREMDWARKLKRVNPRRTISVNIIAGGPKATETLDWCVRSVQGIADEIVVADTGLTTEQRAAFAAYAKVRFVVAPDPRSSGFETPRNIALDASLCDMVLWIDTDERLLNSQEIQRFTRDNMWDAYAIQQHHFSVDASFPPDLPARLFRRNGKMRFYGMIHEHPEMGLNEGPGLVLITAPLLSIAHVGYLTDAVRKQRFDRNYPMLLADEQRYPERKLQKFFRMRDNHLMTMWELRSNGGQVTEAMRQRAQQSVAIFREHFLGERCAYAHLNPLEYYTPALDVLNEGIVFSYGVSAQRDGVGEQGAPQIQVAKFKDHSEAQEHISAMIKRKSERLQSAVW